MDGLMWFYHGKLRDLLEQARSLQDDEYCQHWWNRRSKPEFKALRKIMKF